MLHLVSASILSSHCKPGIPNGGTDKEDRSNDRRTLYGRDDDLSQKISHLVLLWLASLPLRCWVAGPDLSMKERSVGVLRVDEREVNEC
jgi:hypothetical protein